MNTLSDNLVVSLSYNWQTEGFYSTYYVSTTANKYDAFFVGLVYVAPELLTVDVRLNEIIASLKPTTNILKKYMYMVDNKKDFNYALRIYVLYTAKDGTILSRYIDTMLFNKYLFENYDLPAYNYYKSSQDSICPMLQGITNYIDSAPNKQKLDLYPRYPKHATGLVFGQGFLHAHTYGSLDARLSICTMHDNDIVSSLWTTQLSDEQETSYFANVVNYMTSSFSTNVNGIGISSAAMPTDKKITGKKLWKVTVEGQYLYQDQEMIGFVNDMRYPGEFYLKNFYIQEPQAEVVHMIVETNDPEKDIVEVYHDWLPRSGANDVTYEEIQYAPNWIVAYEPHSTDPLSRLFYNDIVSFFGEFSDSLISPAILAQWGIRPNAVLSDPTLLRMPFIVPEREQIETFKTNFEAFQDSQTFTYEDIFLWDTGEIGSIEGKYSTYHEEYITVPLKIAEVDDCAAPYYVQWIDRYGGVQCLPFEGKATKSSTYNKINIINQNTQRLVNAEQTYTLELNTKFLKDSYVPIYEGIFVSPYIRVYDRDNDVCYDVVSLENKYIQKTRNNQGKKLYNLTISLTVNTSENIIF